MSPKQVFITILSSLLNSLFNQLLKCSHKIPFVFGDIGWRRVCGEKNNKICINEKIQSIF